MSDRFIDVDGRRVFMREHGNGAPLVLLHGFPQTGDAWRAVADKLSGRNRVFVPDLPGYGKSDPSRGGDIASASAMLLRALQIAGAEKFALAGHDWGGSIGLRMALDHPESVEKLIVVNAPFRKLDLRRGWHFLALNVPVVPEALLTLFGTRAIPILIRAASANKDAIDPETMQSYGASMADLTRARNALSYYRTSTRSALIRAARSGLSKLPIPGMPARPERELRRVEVPTLIVWGERDPALPPSLIESIERDIDECTVVRLPGVGHFVPEEAPSELAHEIDRFLNPHH